jgi:crotonobetainyl-CoA:carnitine CoA-transferase CaiB-like acyl-CoA transferase/isopropylmalate/homocitrate/citramalate synthase
MLRAPWWQLATRSGVNKAAWRCASSVPAKVKITEVSPRDGLQNEKVLVPAETKLELIKRLRTAGVQAMEATAFVSPKAVPQMADAKEIMAGVAHDTAGSYTCLVPNVRGLEAAVAAGAKEVTVLAAATETMCRKNTNCSLDDALDRASGVLAAAKEKGLKARASVGVTFVCPWEGKVPVDRIAEIFARLHREGCYEIGLCDTIGKATPEHVAAAIDACVAAGVPVEALALHVHDTYGQANANMMAGLYRGVAAFDVSVGGLGGCPFAPGAAGNAAAEDLVYSLNGMGVETGIDLAALADTGAWITDKLGRSHGSRAGAALAGAAARAKRTLAQQIRDKKPPSTAGRTGPLAGYRVVELGAFLAGPFCATTLGYFGADVIKIEPPGLGDPIRRWRSLAEDGTAPWARSLLRNKRSMTVNMKHPEGAAAVKDLIASADVVVENFRPGVMEKFGLGPDAFKELNPGLVYCRVSGYGQDGPYKPRPGFASATEGEGGFRFVNGIPGQPPVRPNMSLGDSLAGVQAAFGVTMALLNRTKTGKGQMIDMALYEAVFNMMEGIIPDYSALGLIRQPSGFNLPDIVPSMTCTTKDGKYIIVGANSDAIFKRVMEKLGRPDMANDEGMKDNAGRVKHKEKVETTINDWIACMTQEEALKALGEAGCPSGPIYDAADMMKDPHYNARGMFEEITTETGLTFKIPALVPKLSDTPGNTEWCGPEVGTHTSQVLKDYLGFDNEKIERLRAEKAFGTEQP